MSIAYVIDEIFEAHVPPRAHPERPARLAHLRERLTSTPLASAGTRLPIRDILDEELGRVHTAAYVEALEHAMPGRAGWLDGDTYFSEKSWSAARFAAGAAVDLAAALLDGRARRGVALVRPPGHHAEADRAMGFCLFNNVAVAAAAARESGARVAVIDFDVHHGNGTQHMFESDADVLFMSVHQYPYYPGSGAPTEIGTGKGVGATVNVGLPAGCGDDDYVAVFDRVFTPAIDRFAPDLILASAGFDAAAADPLAQMNVSSDGYAAIAARLCALADKHAAGRFGAVLEGGYDLDGLADGAIALIAAMMADKGPAPGDCPTASVGGERAILATLEAHRQLGGPS